MRQNGPRRSREKTFSDLSQETINSHLHGPAWVNQDHCDGWAEWSQFDISNLFRRIFGLQSSLTFSISFAFRNFLVSTPGSHLKWSQLLNSVISMSMVQLANPCCCCTLTKLMFCINLSAQYTHQPTLIGVMHQLDTNSSVKISLVLPFQWKPKFKAERSKVVGVSAAPKDRENWLKAGNFTPRKSSCKGSILGKLRGKNGVLAREKVNFKFSSRFTTEVRFSDNWINPSFSFHPLVLLSNVNIPSWVSFCPSQPKMTFI